MATYVQRAQAIRDALINGVTSADVNHALKTASSSAVTDLPENP